MAKPGRTNTILDVGGLRVGNAQDLTVRTGVTVVLPDNRATCAVHVAGGGPGTRETDALKLGTLVDEVDAVVLSGGSVYGLAAADGVTAAMGADGKGFGLVDLPGVPRSPVIPTAILYDLANSGDKDWGRSPPYRELGIRAHDAASSADLAIGSVGAGTGAMAGGSKGGLGSASITTDDGFTVGALVAVNCFGSVTIPGTNTYWAQPFELKSEFGGRKIPSDHTFDPDDWGNAKLNPGARTNTTIACLAVNADLTPSQAQRLSDMAIAGLARAIRPVFAPFDGDVVFTLATAQPTAPTVDPLTLARLGELAASTLARAVARGVYTANLDSGSV